ncbi:efflux RND transporter periplasmic adaptor subunit [Sulfitobacter sabulilitoris]|uniref:Efflux RND transporter periplasmic adaptor subunit n=1 Tax=Sulfitobacter sabulilitoris TaxID=2562655 RepID=A0A5S3PIP9_9RHOB|nr:efflux RND transporter periplasmic adaptor subunit [Sulfitobacter sabulilitoris]TMM54253.1 efflux RND transporter periplasmic adaptor subunit [Sulfitobacter sabulilitoris]
MRIFPVLAAVAVASLLYLAVFERAVVTEFLGLSSPAAQMQAEGTAAATPGDDGASAGRVKVVVHRSEARDIDTAVILRGQTNAARQVDVKAETSARVMSEPLRKGTTVSEGQELCRLDPGTRQDTLAQARAQLDEAQARVPEAQARLAQAQAQLEEARINRDASARLGEDGFASTTRVANAEAAFATAQAAVESARAGLQAAKTGIQSAKAGVALAETELDRVTIHAPFGGLLESDTAELGALLRPGDLCATILQLDPIKLVAFVPETEVARIAVGASARARLAAGGGEVRGTVSFLSRSADPTTRTFRVEIEVRNDDLSISDGQTAEIAIASDGAKAHLLPQSALTLNDDGTLGVRTVDADDVVQFKPVSLMRDTAQGVWLTGLDDVATVIVVGQEFVTAGVTVAPTFRELSQ